ncbi:hypothetical protein [Acidovorax delafieldii]|uniref:hypothetical protein n=1 Tax=Acidovorax delafieldii TaxID=47920 RepID=UPI003ED03E79
MNETNRGFLRIIGSFFLLWAVTLSVTGYWPSLQGFGVSERFFRALMILCYIMGGGALAVALLSRQSKP